MTHVWDHFWFRPGSRIALAATRSILALQALWILLSRYNLPSIVTWPDPFWAGVPRSLHLRFGLTRSFSFESFLFAAAIVALLVVLSGRFTRPACFLAALLLYHLAPLEEIITGNPLTMFRGLTQPLLGLLFVGAARPSNASSLENRWPVAAAQFSMAMTYFLSALSKLHDAGWAWAVGPNIRAIAMAFSTWGVRAPLAPMLIRNEWLCWAIAIGTLVIELSFPIVLVSRTAAKVLVPVAFISHIVIAYALGIVFLSLPLLLLFVDWEWLRLQFIPSDARDLRRV